MSTDNGGTGFPQSMRQRRILDVAREHPTASVETLASMVSSATPQLVEAVLDEHGDPSADDELSTDAGTGTESGTEPMVPNGGSDAPADETTGTDDATESQDTDDSEPSTPAYPRFEELSATQQEVLEAIAATPEATQREIAERFDLSTATINNRVNSIPGFEWTDRESFVEQVLDEPPSPDASTDSSSTDTATIQSSSDDDSDDTDSPQSSSDTASTAAESTQSPADDESAAVDQPTHAAGESTTPTDSAADEPTTPDLEAVEELTESISALQVDIEQLSGRLSALESDAVGESSAFEDAELVHKVAHACLTSDAISESEELRILRTLLD